MSFKQEPISSSVALRLFKIWLHNSPNSDHCTQQEYYMAGDVVPYYTVTALVLH